MKKNIGPADRKARFLIGAALLSLLFILDGSMRYIGLIGLIPLATAWMQYCPLYCPLGMNTCGTGGGAKEGKSCCGGGCHGKDKAQDKDEEA